MAAADLSDFLVYILLALNFFYKQYFKTSSYKICSELH